VDISFRRRAPLVGCGTWHAEEGWGRELEGWRVTVKINLSCLICSACSFIIAWKWEHLQCVKENAADIEIDADTRSKYFPEFLGNWFIKSGI